MKPIRYCALLAVVALCNFVNVSAQDRPNRGNRGNFDPEQMRERMMTRVREEMDVKDDADWKPISVRVEKVMEARREAGNNGMGMLFRPRRQGNDQGGDNNNRRRFGPEPSPEAEALQKAIESKASNDEVKSRLAKYREAQKAKHEKLEKAQEDLRKVLTTRQEAVAVMLNLLD
jgi:hypothetical protein